VKRAIGCILSRVLPIPVPRVVSGFGTVSKIGALLDDVKCKKPLIVTDKVLVQHGLVSKCTDSLTSGYEVFDKVEPNPPVNIVEDCYRMYKQAGCDSIVAFGGGSAMDVAKVVGAKIVRPTATVEQFNGFFKVVWPLPPLIAVPTTAGTGSETTVAAVITVPEKSSKIVIADPCLVPKMAVLDPSLIMNLPKHITAAVGMDALTHAIESYISAWSSPFTRKQSLCSVQAIFENLIASYHEGHDLRAREAMLNASFQAGVAFTRANLGYVHAIAHQFGGMFHTPHGDANAMILPHVLTSYIRDECVGSNGDYCLRLLCDLAKAAGLCQKQASEMDLTEKRETAKSFIAAISAMNKQMHIPTVIEAMRASDVEEVAVRACKEAHGETHTILSSPVDFLLEFGYPVPKYLTFEETKQIVAKFLPAEEKQKFALLPEDQEEEIKKDI